MSVIDADGHIIEPEAMFEHLPEEFYPRRPIPVHLPVDTVRGDFNDGPSIMRLTGGTTATRRNFSVRDGRS